MVLVMYYIYIYLYTLVYTYIHVYIYPSILYRVNNDNHRGVFITQCLHNSEGLNAQSYIGLLQTKVIIKLIWLCYF